MTRLKALWTHLRYVFTHSKQSKKDLRKMLYLVCPHVYFYQPFLFHQQQTLGNRLEAQTPGSEQWVESAPPTRSHTPSSVHSHTTGSATAPGVDHFMTSNGGVSGNISTTNDKASPNGINFANGNFLLNVAREREAQQNSR